jgi:hypothetical protein
MVNLDNYRTVEATQASPTEWYLLAISPEHRQELSLPASEAVTVAIFARIAEYLNKECSFCDLTLQT